MPPRSRPRIDPEDLVLYAVLVFIGMIPVIGTLIERTAFGFNATLGLMMVVVGVVGTLVHVARVRRRFRE